MYFAKLLATVSLKEVEHAVRLLGVVVLTTALLVAVGDGEVVNGQKQPMQVKVNDKILFAKYSGSEIKLDGTTYIVLKQTDILAVVEE